MGKFDKDRYLKELAIRFCLAQGAIPFLEVTVTSSSELTESIELLTDIDVLGISAVGDGRVHRTIYDCKSTSKMSAINRALWASGLVSYTNSDDAFVILKNKAVSSHRLSALTIRVDLHDEVSFIDLGRTFDNAFPVSFFYQSSIDRWNKLEDQFQNNIWSRPLYETARNVTPLSRSSTSAFRRLMSDLRGARGYFDPKKDGHVAIYLDAMCAAFVLWTTMARDVRRFFEPTMMKPDFERLLNYYIWGGRESYNLRRQLREKMAFSTGESPSLELPGWTEFVNFAGTVLSSPKDVFDCAHICREHSLRMVNTPDLDLDKILSKMLGENKRLRQFILSMNDYMVAAGGLPRDLGRRVQELLLKAP